MKTHINGTEVREVCCQSIIEQLDNEIYWQYDRKIMFNYNFEIRDAYSVISMLYKSTFPIRTELSYVIKKYFKNLQINKK